MCIRDRAKGDVEIDGVPCSFDETTGIGLNLAWKQENGKDYWYENGQRPVSYTHLDVYKRQGQP